MNICQKIYIQNFRSRSFQKNLAVIFKIIERKLRIFF